MSPISIALFAVSATFGWFLVGALVVVFAVKKFGYDAYLFSALIYGTVSLALLGWLLR